MEVHSMRLDHGPIQTNNMYPQRQPNHRPSHGQAVPPGPGGSELYKPSRSPLAGGVPTSRCPPFSVSSQQLQAPPNAPTTQLPQRYPPHSQPSSASPMLPGAGGAAYHHPHHRQQAVPANEYLLPSHPAQRTNRISLLHPEYHHRSPTSHGGVVCLDAPPHSTATGSGQQPLKKMRLQDGGGGGNKEMVQAGQQQGMQPLRIDTRPGAYNPQVEAISPTLPEQVSQEDQAFRTTKDELIQQIGKVDREIAKAESQIAILKKKQAELEEIANKPSAKSVVEEDERPKHQSLPQKIYAENRKKAQAAHAQLESLGPKVDWPLYNQPSDTQVYHVNKRRHAHFKRRLLDYFKKRHTEAQARNSHLIDTYSKLMQEWLRKVEKIESSTKRKVKEAKNREFFEKVFPGLRKQREDKERFNRVGARVKSEADMEEIMDNLQEQAQEDKKMRSYAVIPPLLLDPKEKRIRYQNNNGFVEDMEAVYKSRQFLNVWTPTEKEIFKEKYLQHPKNFGVIASYLDRKSVSDCVQYYYLSKKTENYKQLLRKSRQRTRSSRNNTQKVNSSANTSVVDILTTGVTTRLQREQQQKTGQQPRSTSESSSTAPNEPSTSASPPPPAASTTTTATTTVASPTSCTTTSTTAVVSSASSPITTPLPASNSAPTAGSPAPASTAGQSANASVVSPANSGAAAAITVTVSATGGVVMTTEEKDDKQPKFNDFNSFEDYNRRVLEEQKAKENVDDIGEGEKQEGVIKTEEEKDGLGDMNATAPNTPVAENKKKKERRKDRENSAMETSDEDVSSIQDKAAQGTCAVCSAQLGPSLHSRPLQPSHAHQYGLREDQVGPTSRVCNTCRCKCVRSRYTHCPLSTCPNARGRVKRLRHLPHRLLHDTSAEVREAIFAEFRIPPGGGAKCCSACYNRIQRRLGPAEEWPEEEVGRFRMALTENGANWQAIGERLGKPAQQVRSFYAANRKRLNLENCLGDRKPALTDDEESGSSTSSCEEPQRRDRERERHSSDTASAAESPPSLPGQNQIPIKKEDYDSSATETADEAQTPDHYQTATITPISNDCQPRQNPSPMSVKDLVLNVIEFSLMKNPGSQQPQNTTSGMTPTISSILNNDSNEVTIVSEYNLNNINNQQPGRVQQVQQIPQPRNDMSLAKLVTPLIAATITPVTGPIQPQPQPEPPSRDDLVVVQIPDNRGEPETLDLSIKKPREQQQGPPPQQQHQKHQPPQMQRSEPYMHHQERKSPAFIRQQPKLPSPKPANPSKGSITLGTPIINQARFEGMLRQMPEAAKMGSITQGTPIHMPHNMQEKQRIYEYYPKPSRMAPQQNTVPQQFPSQYRQPPTSYIPEQQLNSRQIIFNDYITSQQMLGRRPEKPQYYTAASSPHRTPPPPQQRQGVIQRHTRPQYLPMGHEALSSLVDVAVQQPSLPVPNAPHEGLGKTMADNIMEQPHRFQIIQQQHQQQLRHQQQQRIEAERRVYYQAAAQPQQHQVRQQQARSDSSTLTAASLIDAIITHQINQTVEGGREVVQNPREPPRPGDLLFQNFQRDGPAQSVHENNGERPSSVISVDLDSDTVSKNLTVKELTDSVISHDFSSRPVAAAAAYYQFQEDVNEQWKRRLQQQQKQQESKQRSATPQQQQEERQIIRIAQPQQQKYHVEPVSPSENNHWSEQNFRRYPQPQSHMSPLDYVKNRIVEVMRTEDDNKKDVQEKDHRSDSPGDMVIDEEKHENDYGRESQQQQQQQNQQHQQQTSGGGSYSYPFKESNNDGRVNEPKPLLSAQYEPLSDED